MYFFNGDWVFIGEYGFPSETCPAETLEIKTSTPRNDFEIIEIEAEIHPPAIIKPILVKT